MTQRTDSELSAVEAARRLGIGLDYLYGLLWSGKLTGRKVGRKWRVSVASVEARLKALGAVRLQRVVKCSEKPGSGVGVGSGSSSSGTVRVA